MSRKFFCDRCDMQGADPTMTVMYCPGSVVAVYTATDGSTGMPVHRVTAELCQTCSLSFSEWLAAGGKKV